MRSYRARARVGGHPYGKTTDTSDFRRAELFAKSWFRALKKAHDNENGASVVSSDTSMFRAARLYFLSLENPAKRANAEERWNGIKDFFRDADVTDVGSRFLKS